MSIKILHNIDCGNLATIKNVPDPLDDNDIISKNYFNENKFKIITGVCPSSGTTINKTLNINNYTLSINDLLAITFIDGFSATNATLNINNTVAYNIRVGGANVTTNLISVTNGTAFTLLFHFDGTYFNTTSTLNTTYTAISNDEIDAGTATITRSITGQQAQYLVDTKTLKRASEDFNSFTEKTTPVSTDIILIEDSTNGFSKAKVQLSNLISTSSISSTKYSTILALG